MGRHKPGVKESGYRKDLKKSLTPAEAVEMMEIRGWLN